MSVDSQNMYILLNVGYIDNIFSCSKWIFLNSCCHITRNGKFFMCLSAFETAKNLHGRVLLLKELYDKTEL